MSKAKLKEGVIRGTPRGGTHDWEACDSGEGAVPWDSSIQLGGPPKEVLQGETASHGAWAELCLGRTTQEVQGPLGQKCPGGWK